MRTLLPTIVLFIFIGCTKQKENLQVSVQPKDTYWIEVNTNQASVVDRKFEVWWSFGESTSWGARDLITLPAGETHLLFDTQGLMFEKNINWVKYKEVPLNYNLTYWNKPE